MYDEPARSLTVSIFGADYPLKNVTDPETVNAIARYVDRQMREVAGSVALRSTPKVAVLTAMQISTELFALRDEIARVREQMEGYAETLNRAMETAEDDPEMTGV